MTDINTSNAIAQERVRIREEVVKLSSPVFGFPRLIPRDEVLRIIRNDQEV